MTREILKVSKKTHSCESQKYESKNWYFLVLRAYCKGCDCSQLLSVGHGKLSTSHRQTWHPAKLPCRIPPCVLSSHSPSVKWDLGTEIWAWRCWRLSAYKTLLTEIHSTGVFFYELLVPLIDEAYRPWQPFLWARIKTGSISRSRVLDLLCYAVSCYRTISNVLTLQPVVVQHRWDLLFEFVG